MAKLFQLSEFVDKDELYHISQVDIKSPQDISMHSHDYYEIFLVVQGAVTHHINKQKIKLNIGDMVMIRPHDVHRFESINYATAILNIAFPTEVAVHIKNRYFPDEEQYLWSTQYLPHIISLSRELYNKIILRIQDAMRNPRTLLELDSLLLYIFRHIIIFRNDLEQVNAEIPFWLFNAISKFNSADILRYGAPKFVELCDRNYEYVSKIIRHYFNKSLVEFVNEIKMKYAATQLSMTVMPIKEIAQNCGFGNLGHFYATFKRQYSYTPYKFRKVNLTSV